MIPSISLDDETFETIMERVKKQLPGLCPAWTDYNYHDPGITFLELFAWFTELQRFHLDQTGEVYLRKYWKLLGIRQRGVTPAHVRVRMEDLPSPTWFPAGSRFYAQEVCFETIESRFLSAAEVRQVVCIKYGAAERDAKRRDVKSGRLDFPAFGEQPAIGDALWIGIDGELAVGVRHHLSTEVAIKPPAEVYMTDMPYRNPFDPEEKSVFIPLVEYRLTYQSRDGEREAVIHKDTTHQLLCDGEMVFSIDKEMLPGRDGLYWLSLVLTGGQYDLPPVLKKLTLAELALRQTDTRVELHKLRLGTDILPDTGLDTRLAKEGEYLLFVASQNGFRRYERQVVRKQKGKEICYCIPGYPEKNNSTYCLLILYEAADIDKIRLGSGDGSPSQTYQTKMPHLCGEGLAILVETERGSGCYELWEKQDDLDASGPNDRHFCFNEMTGELFFGDGIHGRMPVGEILLAAARTSLGMAGNVKAAQICLDGGTADMPDEADGGYRVWNEREASGGTDGETREECQGRLVRCLREPQRAVTYEDFAYLAEKTPGLAIENVKAIPASARIGPQRANGEETVTLVVKPYAYESRPRLSETYRRNIRRMLEPCRMIGTNIEILSPEYVDITVFVEVYSNMHSAMAKERVTREIRGFFEDIRADFGAVICHSNVYGRIDVMDCVSGIRVLRIDAQGENVRRNQRGDILLPVNGLACLMELTCIVSPERNGVYER